MRHFMFEDYDTGEEFLVCACDIEEAFIIARDYFADPSYICEVDEFEAESSGLDEY